MADGEIFNHTDPREILVHLFQQKKNKNPLYSMRAWAKKLGFRNPSFLSDILNGKRKLKPDLALRISESIDLEDDEKKYFESLVFFSNAKTEAERAFYQSVSEKFVPQKRAQVLASEKYPELKEWYYGVLDEMTCLSDFKEDYAYLAKRLGHDITPQAVSVAIKDMLRVGLIARDKKGKLKRPKKWMIRAQDDDEKVEHLQIRKYKKKFLEKAVAALEGQGIGEKIIKENLQIVTTNVPIALRDLPKLDSLFKSTSEKIYELESSQKADEVYYIGLISYRLTQPPEKRTTP